MADIEFVSYSGRYPNLCHGVLILKVNNKEYKFGHDYNSDNWKEDGNYDFFWFSGGGCGFTEHSDYINEKEWIMNDYCLPEELKPYSQELIDCFNEHVQWGCCGGCL